MGKNYICENTIFKKGKECMTETLNFSKEDFKKQVKEATNGKAKFEVMDSGYFSVKD